MQPTPIDYSIETSYWPTVTVIISTYKRPKMLMRALNSVLAQTFTDFELIIVHDGHIDQEMVNICAMFDKRFTDMNVIMQLITLQENSGYQCVPKNVGTHMARGDYIAYLDDDNEWTPDHLEVLVDAMEEGVQWPDFVYGRRLYVRDEGAPEHLTTGESPFVKWGESAKLRLAEGTSYNFIDTSDFLIARGSLWHMQMALGHMWDERTRRFADWRLISEGVFFCGLKARAVDKIVQIYHWHAGNIQHTRPLMETPQPVRLDKQEELQRAGIRLHSDAG